MRLYTVHIVIAVFLVTVFSYAAFNQAAGFLPVTGNAYYNTLLFFLFAAACCLFYLYTAYKKVKPAAKVLDAISDDFTTVYIVNLHKDTVKVVQTTKFFEGLLDEAEYVFSAAQQKYLEGYVKDEHRNRYMFFTDMGFVHEQLEKGVTPEITYEKKDGNWITLRVYKTRGYTSENAETVWIYYKATEKARLAQKYKHERPYLLKLSLSIRSGKYIVTSFSESFDALINNKRGDYKDCFERLLDLIIFDDEKRAMRIALSYDSLKKQIESGNFSTRTYQFHLFFFFETIFVECSIFFIQMDRDVLVTFTLRDITSEDKEKEALNKIIMEQARRLKEDYLFMLDAINAAVEFRDYRSAAHERRIRMNTMLILKELMRKYPKYNLTDEEIQVITMASIMHDVGKIAMPDAILLKAGQLTDEEFEIMKQHTVKGCEMLEKIRFMRMNENFDYYYNICRWHHERYDGSGYPDGLKCDEIPIYVQAVAVADCFDALISDRPYKKAYNPKMSKKMIMEGKCGTFNPDIMDCLKDVELDATI